MGAGKGLNSKPRKDHPEPERATWRVLVHVFVVSSTPDRGRSLSCYYRKFPERSALLSVAGTKNGAHGHATGHERSCTSARGSPAAAQRCLR